MAAEFRALGFDVTEQVGMTGVVGVLRNGEGPALMIRAAGVPEDLLPVLSEAEYRTPVTVSDSELTRRIDGALRQWFPPERFEVAEAAT